MKQLLLIALMMITSYGVGAQNQFSDYVEYLKDKEGIIQMPDPRKIQRPEFHLFPRPLEVRKTYNRVIVVFDRKEWEAMRFMQHKRWQRQVEVQRQVEDLRRRRESYQKRGW